MEKPAPVSLFPISHCFALYISDQLICFIAADDVAKLLKEVGAQADKAAIDNLIKAINGRKLHDLVNEGSSKLATISAPAAAGIICYLISLGGAPAAAAGGAPAQAAKKEEPKKEEKKEEEADVDMGGLFGDDY